MKDLNNKIEIEIIEPDGLDTNGEILDVCYEDEKGNVVNENKFIKFLKKIFK